MPRRLLPLLALLALAGGAALLLLARLPGDSSAPAGPGPAARRPGGESPSARLEGRAAAVPTEAGEMRPGSDGSAAGWEPLVVCATRYATAQPIPDVLVVATDALGRRHEGRTDAEGEYAFRNLAPGIARIEASLEGWISETIDDLAVGAEGGREYFSFARSTSVGGRVVSAADGSPIAGARVVAAASGTVGDARSVKRGDVWCIGDSRADGRFRLATVPLQHDATLTVLAQGFAREARTVVLPDAAAAALEIEIRLFPGGRLRGTVGDRNGNVVSGARVYVFPDGDEWMRAEPYGSWSDETRTMASLCGVTDADGQFEIEGLALDARYAATAFARDYARAEDVVALVVSSDSPELSVSLVLRTPGRIELVARTDEGEPVAGGQVSLRHLTVGPAWEERKGKTDASGRLVIRGLIPGVHHLGLRADGFLAAARDVDVPVGDTARLDLVLDRGAAISGTVTDEEGQPLADAWVAAGRAGADRWPQATTRSDSAGRFSIEGLEAGVHSVQASAAGYLFDRVENIVAPADGLRLVGVPFGVVKGRLVLAPGVPDPERIFVGTYSLLGGGSARYEPWPDEPLTWYVPGEPRVLCVEGDGFARWELEVRVEPGTTRDLGDISLPPGVDLAGIVVGPDGEPVPHATVEAPALQFRSTRTDPAGRFALSHLPAGTQEIRISADGYIGRRLERMCETSDRDLRIALDRGGLLRVRLVDAEGVPVVGFFVQVVPSDLEEEADPDAYWDRAGWGESTEQGRVQLRLPPGAYRVEIQAGDAEEDRWTAVGATKVSEGETVELELRVP